MKERKVMFVKPCQLHPGWRLIAGSIAIVSVLAFASRTTQGQFNSGSTGSDGPFAPTVSQNVQLPASGIFNYTTISIPSGVTITYVPNANNTPVILLASGTVTLAGIINVNASGANGRVGGKGGPGGYRGGTGGVGVSGVTDGLAGDGPGGGSGGTYQSGPGFGSGGGGAGYSGAGGNGSLNGGGTGGTAGPAYGGPMLVPLLGGSGGGGGAPRPFSFLGGGGGGGGGAILIASSSSISLSSSSFIQANASSGALNNDSSSLSFSGSGGAGSGGAIRLVANTISGSGTLQVSAGSSTGNGGSGSPGRIRIEAFDASVNPTISPSSAGVSFGFPQAAIPTNEPRLRIASVAGIAAPVSPVGSLQAPPDIVVPAAQTNPVTVALEASNIAPGLIADVTVTAAGGARTTVQSTAFAGTIASSTATASVTLPDGSSVVAATATVLLTASASPLYINGERIDRIEVAAVYGGPSELTYITRSGKRIKQASR